MTTQYPYSIKNLKTLNTHDGQALTATLYRGKLKIGSIEDAGRGGGVWPFFASAEEAELFRAWVSTLGEYTYPATAGMDAFTMTHNTESALDMLLTEVENAKEAAKMDRSAKTQLVYREAGDGETAYRTAKIPASALALPQPALVAMYRQKAPWFGKAKDVWIIGQGWTAAASI